MSRTGALLVWILCSVAAVGAAGTDQDPLDITLQLSASHCIEAETARAYLQAWMEAPAGAVQLVSTAVLGSQGHQRQSRRLLQGQAQPDTWWQQAAQVLTSYLEQAEPDHQYDEATQSAEEQLQAYMHEYTAAQGRDHGQLCRQLFTLQIQPEQVHLMDNLASAVESDSLQQQMSRAGLEVRAMALLTPYERIYSRGGIMVLELFAPFAHAAGAGAGVHIYLGNIQLSIMALLVRAFAQGV